MDNLGKLFGSQARVKILRLFLLNPLEVFDIAMVSEKSKVSLSDARREIALLKKIDILADKSFFKEVSTKSGSKKAPIRKRAQGVQLKQGSPLLMPLKNLIVSETPLNRGEVAQRFKTVGKIKFLAISGIFIDAPESRVDVLIVGDDLKKRSIETVLKSIEAEIGKELSYGALETSDFLYRVSVYDKFVRDILDFRHDRIIDKLGVE
ncbi:MAG TPA: hypothetical protein DDX26_00070 [Candidatus Yonathbacteria bacterium]|nr:MAG: hypothetical protein EPN27_01070 [Patescibacteria group bacterium]HBH71243.1 hypothetical protein [Candidatus Yonathbacteria bacterium]